MKTAQTTEINFDVPAAVAHVPVLASAEAPPPATLPEGASILNIIERAARDPSVDIDKLERLYRMKLDMEARDAKAAYLSALATMQPKLPVITKNGVISKNEKDDRGNKTGRQEAMTKYAKWEDVVEGITPVLAEHGFSLSFRVAQPTPDRVAVSGVLGHRAGHTEETTLALPIDSTGAKNNVQGWGSSVSYGKRYTAFALLNISARGEDDDGNTAGWDQDIDRLSTGPRDENGKPISTYNVEKIKKAAEFADNLVQNLNLAPNKEAAKELWRANGEIPKGKKKSPLDWLKDNSPGQFLRVQTAYENVVGLE
ncbi:MAG: ERF family protein [Alphaproteobacteria bacterium]|nr:ERF family protein [Alphaproteobacteria bacterium]